MLNRYLKLGGVILMAATMSWSQSTPAPKDSGGTKKSSKAPEPQTTKAPASAVAAKEPKFDIANIDQSLDPCTDFYAFSCSKWMKNNPIPADYPDWVSFSEVYEHNLGVLRGILEKAAANDPKRNLVTQKIGDYYASCMDESAVNKAGFAPLKPELDRISALKDKTEMMELIAHEGVIGPNPIFAFGAGADFHDANMTIAQIDQAWLSLPDRDYYIKDDADMVDVRKLFLDHMKKMFTMIGQSPEDAAKSAATVLKLETEMARASMDRTARRDPKNLDHKVPVSEVMASAPNFHLDRYFAAAGVPAFKEVNLTSPDYFKNVNPLIESTPLADWKTYLTWQMLNSVAAWL